MGNLSEPDRGKTQIRPLVSMVDILKSYDGRINAVSVPNLTIHDGEFLTFLGPSGSGKTSTLMMLAGFESPTHGDILMDGQSISQMPPHKRNIGMVFQNYALFPHMTVAENVGYALRARRRPTREIQDSVASALAMVRMANLGGRKPRELSGGQQQRVALARALVFKPRLVLMDEPLGALDKNLRDHMQLEIKRLHRELGITIVYVTHDQSEALTMSDRIAVFDTGTIQQLATPEDIYERPANAFVAGFVGESNQLHGVVVDLRQDVCAVCTADGQQILAKAQPNLTAGDAVVVSVRPDRIGLGDGRPKSGNVFACPLDQVVYHGDHLRCTVEFGGIKDFTVKLPRGSIVTPSADGKVLIGWLADNCVAFKAG